MGTISFLFSLVLTFENAASLSVYNTLRLFILFMFWQMGVMKILLGFSEWVMEGLFISLLPVFCLASALVRGVYTWNGSGEPW